jgi:hypothetical protein
MSTQGPQAENQEQSKHHGSIIGSFQKHASASS